jgi:hypothetical protein
LQKDDALRRPLCPLDKKALNVLGLVRNGVFSPSKAAADKFSPQTPLAGL